MAEPIFRGVATALITPFTADGSVDWKAFEKIICWQIEEGIDGLVIAGTTGEGPTLTDEEHRQVLKFAMEVSEHKVPLIAGTGSNHTDYAISLTEFSSDLGYDGMLVVTPADDPDETLKLPMTVSGTEEQPAARIELLELLKATEAREKLGLNFADARAQSLLEVAFTGRDEESVSHLTMSAPLTGEALSAAREAVPECPDHGALNLTYEYGPGEKPLATLKGEAQNLWIADSSSLVGEMSMHASGSADPARLNEDVFDLSLRHMVTDGVVIEDSSLSVHPTAVDDQGNFGFNVKTGAKVKDMGDFTYQLRVGDFKAQVYMDLMANPTDPEFAGKFMEKLPELLPGGVINLKPQELQVNAAYGEGEQLIAFKGHATGECSYQLDNLETAPLPSAGVLDAVVSDLSATAKQMAEAMGITAFLVPEGEGFKAHVEVKEGHVLVNGQQIM